MAAEQKITLSVIKADVGGWAGHSTSHPDLLALAQEHVDAAVKRGLLVDGQVLHVGDDVELIMTHHRADGNSEVHQFAWDTFLALTELAKRMKLYGAGQDMLGLPQRKNISTCSSPAPMWPRRWCRDKF